MRSGQSLGEEPLSVNHAAIIATTAALLLASPAAAQNWVLEGNIARSEGLTGGEIGLGYDFTYRWLRLTPIAGAFVYKGDNDRYDRQTVSGGNEICRDTTNGQFAAKEKCNNIAAKAYGKLEGAVRLGSMLEVGGGVRVSDETQPYGLVALRTQEQFAVQAAVGKDYYAIGLRLRF
jgi:hypothetical protein